MTAPILEASGIHAWYGSSHVLHGVDIAVHPGETVGLLGRNGMGKSTLIRTLLGHVKQREGRIAVHGQDFSRAAPHEVARAGVGYVPEGRVRAAKAATTGPTNACSRPSRGWPSG